MLVGWSVCGLECWWVEVLVGGSVLLGGVLVGWSVGWLSGGGLECRFGGVLVG